MSRFDTQKISSPVDMATVRRLGPYVAPETLAGWLLEMLGQDLTPRMHELICGLTAHLADEASLHVGTYGYRLDVSWALDHTRARMVETAAPAVIWFPNVQQPARDASLAAWSTYATALGRRVSRSALRFTRGDRLSREERARLGFGDLTRKEYMQRFLLARRLRNVVDHAEALRAEAEERFNPMSWEGLLDRVSDEVFAAEPWTAFLILFHLCTLLPSGSKRPNGYDNRHQADYGGGQRRRWARQLRDELWSACQEHAARTNWWALAHVMPTEDVLSQLPADQQDGILGRWTSALHREAYSLRAFWMQHDIDADSMALVGGVDGGAWNGRADRFERLRCGYVQAMHACGRAASLETCYPSRVPHMRILIREDHDRPVPASCIHDDVRAWRRLPKPWDVVLDDAQCSPREITDACAQAGFDASKRGWLAAPTL